ncbi:MAG: hypothetical protein O3C43_12935 [Verrucomicrobia bacterium]|nr:hypothetical protein [Verrucomicrobiota bacterium]
MKSGLLLRFILTLALALGISSTQLLSQDKDATEKSTPPQNQGGGKGGGKGGAKGGQQGGGKGGQRGGQAANPGGLPDMSSMTQEQKAAALNTYRHTKMTAMAEACEVRDDQMEAFVKTQVEFENAMLKGFLQMQSAGRDRDKRQAIGQSMTKANSTSLKAMKTVLDKDQMKVYTKEMKARMPQQQGGKGGGKGGK